MQKMHTCIKTITNTLPNTHKWLKPKYVINRIKKKWGCDPRMTPTWTKRLSLDRNDLTRRYLLTNYLYSEGYCLTKMDSLTTETLAMRAPSGIRFSSVHDYLFMMLQTLKQESRHQNTSLLYSFINLALLFFPLAIVLYLGHLPRCHEMSYFIYSCIIFLSTSGVMMRHNFGADH